MKTKLFVVFLAGLFMTACNEDNSLYDPISEEGVELATFDNPHLNGVTITRPLKVKGGGEINYSFNPMVCGPGNILIEVEGSGTATHLGKYDLFLSYCRSQTGQPLTITSGYHIVANGDTLFTSLRINENGIPAVGEENGVIFQIYDYTGGTGRFEEATGWVKLYFNFDPPVFPTSYTNYGEGEITY